MLQISQLLTDAYSSLSKSGDPSLIEALRIFQCPRLVCVVEVCFPIVRDRLTLFVYEYQRVIVFWGCRPVVRHVDLLRVPDGNGAVVLQGCRSSPERRNTRLRRLKEGRDIMEGLEVVPYIF